MVGQRASAGIGSRGRDHEAGGKTPWMRRWLPACVAVVAILRRATWVAADFMLYRTSKGEIHFLDFREKAPGRRGCDMYLDKQGNVKDHGKQYGISLGGCAGQRCRLGEAETPLGKLGLAKVDGASVRLRATAFNCHAI